MDSLTQIVLGAACGEIALGKKIGNKALLFGAIGGTIPDLDVFIGKFLYNNEIQAMAFHRGFMHSLLFATLSAFLFGWFAYKFYNTGIRRETIYILKIYEVLINFHLIQFNLNSKLKTLQNSNFKHTCFH